MTTAAGGFGFLVGSLRGAQNDNAGVDFPVIHTDSAYAGGSITTNTATAGVFGHNTNSPYASADFGSGKNQIQQRPVSCGIRIRYVGTALNRGGVAFLLEHPDHDTLDTFTEADMRTYDRSGAVPITNDWLSVTFQPVRESEMTYISSAGSTSSFLGIVVQAPAGVSLAFEWEYYLNVEIIGSLARGKTYTPVEPEATHKVTNILGSLYESAQKAVTPELIMNAAGYAYTYGTSGLPGLAAKVSKMSIRN